MNAGRADLHVAGERRRDYRPEGTSRGTSLFATLKRTSTTITQIVTKIGSSSAAQTFAGPIKSITAHKSTAGIMGIVGIVAALWSASSYVGAFMRASNVIYETPEGRPIWKPRPLQVLVTGCGWVAAVVPRTSGSQPRCARARPRPTASCSPAGAL